MSQRRGNEYWINPLLKRFNLVRKSEADLARDTCWRQIEECELSDRIGKLVAEVNRAAGHHLLEMLDFLPPQKNVLRVTFDRQRVKHSLEIVIRESGIVLMFSTRRRVSVGWGRYISTHSMRHNSTLVWEQDHSPGRNIGAKHPGLDFLSSFGARQEIQTGSNTACLLNRGR